MKKIKRIMAGLFALILCIQLIFLPTEEVYAETNYTMNISVQYGQTEARSMFNKINEFRTGSDAWYWAADNTTKITCPNLSELTYDYTLEKVAMQRAAEIAIYYSHTRPNGDRCFTAYSENGYYYVTAGENIAAGFMTADSVFTAWVEEDENYSGQGHRRNMLNSNFTAVGIGHVYYNGYHYWVQEFGAPVVNTEYTTPNDSDTVVGINVAPSKVKSVQVTSQESGIKVKCGQTIEIPQCDVKVILNSTWPGHAAPVITDIAWIMETNSYVKYLGTNITGITEGTAYLTSNVFGTDVSLPVTVIHDWDSGVVTTEATCTDKGVKTYTCTGCKAAKTEIITELGHDYDINWTIDKEATCTEAGYKSHHCKRCGEKNDVTEIPVTKHSYDGGKVTKEPTCTDTGVKTYTCINCGTAKTEVLAELGHDYDTNWTTDKEATCTEAGYKSHHCKRCEEKRDVTEIPVTGHSYDGGKVTKEPTYTSTGIKTYICISCGAVREEEIPKLQPEKSGLIIENGDIYYYENNEISTTFTGIVKDDTTGKRYYFESGVAARDKQVYDPQTDAWYWFDADGTMAVGKDVYVPESNENRENGKWVRYDENGGMVKGEDYRNGGLYRFDEITGEMIKGWYTSKDGKTYYYNDVTGQMEHGAVTIGGTPCAFDDETGVAVNCAWYKIDGNEYWYENGVRQGLEGRGKEIYDSASDAWYWLDSIDGGKKAVSKDVYQESYAGAFADRPDGTGKWVRYDEDGHMIKGWSEMNGNTYYFDYQTGAMAKGWANIGGMEYYFNKETGIRE